MPFPLLYSKNKGPDNLRGCLKGPTLGFMCQHLKTNMGTEVWSNNVLKSLTAVLFVFMVGIITFEIHFHSRHSEICVPCLLVQHGSVLLNNSNRNVFFFFQLSCQNVSDRRIREVGFLLVWTVPVKGRGFTWYSKCMIKTEPVTHSYTSHPHYLLPPLHIITSSVKNTEDFCCLYAVAVCHQLLLKCAVCLICDVWGQLFWSPVEQVNWTDKK